MQHRKSKVTVTNSIRFRDKFPYIIDAITCIFLVSFHLGKVVDYGAGKIAQHLRALIPLL